MSDTYEKLIALLDANKASFRLIDHAPEGQTDKVSAMRGHPVEAAAKCIVLIVKIGKKSSRFVPAVVPGNARVCSWTMWVSSCLCFLPRERSLKITLRSIEAKARSPGTGRLAPSLCSAAARFRFSTSIFSVSTWAAALAQVFSTFHKKNAGASI